MTTSTLNEIHQIGLAALARDLGPGGMVRFIQIFETGYGNYAQERALWLKDQSVEEIAERIKRRRIQPE